MKHNAPLVIVRSLLRNIILPPLHAAGLRPDRTGVDTHECTGGAGLVASRVQGLACHFRDLLPGVVTLPEHFRSLGYTTLSYGKVFHQVMTPPTGQLLRVRL